MRSGKCQTLGRRRVWSGHARHIGQVSSPHTVAEVMGRDERRILEALRASEGWLPRTALRWTAFGGQVLAAQLSESLKVLMQDQLIESKFLDRVVGKYGAGTNVYRITAKGVAALAENEAPLAS